ncbi:GHKL domain-containing protein [Lactiplantibacillus pentosus]|nr:GHKL domain-containing protein [Lactiplantibacillus pentosus]
MTVLMRSETLMAFVQTGVLFLFVKSILRDWGTFSYLDTGYALAVIMISRWIFDSIGTYASMPILLMVMLYAWRRTRSLSESFLIGLQVGIWSIVIDHVSDLIVYALKSDGGYLLTFASLQLLSLVILNVILMNTHVKSTFNRPSLNRVTGVLLLVIYLYIIVSEGLNDELRLVVSNLVVLLVVIGLAVALYDEYRITIRAKYQVQQQQAQIKNDTRYMNEIEVHYNELRNFRHDYQNMMLSISEYLKTDDLTGLQEYYQKNIAPVTKRVADEQYNLEDLSRVKVKSVKSILFNKLNYAQSQGIKVHFELKQVLERVATNELDLDIALGIILDNAVEAVVGNYHGEITSAIFQTAHSTVFLIQNNLFEQLPPLWQLKEVGYSTKGTNRGLSLSRLGTIVNRNENMILETRVLENRFVQRLTVAREEV